MATKDLPAAVSRSGPLRAGEEPLGHRDRLIAALAQSIEEKGYRDTVVADVVRIARTSRRNFYEHFKDRDALFLALFDAANEEVIEAVAAAARPDRPWDEQVDAALGAYMDAMVARPALWMSFARELPALGKEGAERQRATLARFAELLVNLVESGRRAQPELESNPLTIEMATVIVGGLRELIVSAAEQGRDIRELRPIAAQTIKAILDATVLRTWAGD
jgi:AcrR family transcriptional regulator